MTSPWPNPPQLPPSGPRVDEGHARPQTYCCPLAAGGDFCDCAEVIAEMAAAFLNPIYIEHRTDDTWSCER